MVLSLILASAMLPGGQSAEYAALFGGNEAGKTVVESPLASGLKSHCLITLGSIKVESKIELAVKDGKLQRMSLFEASGPNSGTITVEGGKFSIVRGKDTVVVKDQPFDVVADAYFSPYHPDVVNTIWDAMQRKPNENLRILDLSSLQVFESKPVLNRRVVQAEAGSYGVADVRLLAGGLPIDLAFVDGLGAVGLKVTPQNFAIVRRGYEGVFESPYAKYPELSGPTGPTKSLKNQRAKMRDGVELAADVVMPRAGEKHPVILLRTPYGRETIMISAESFASRGYAVVVQDVRGRGGSGGKFDPFNQEVNDGYDTLKWLTEQFWCDGNVGMIGGSYGATVQWSAAVTGHPALKCIIPQVSPPDPVRNVPWDHGAFLLAGSVWWSAVVAKDGVDVNAISFTPDKLKALETLPISKVDQKVIGQDVSFFNQWLKRPKASDWAGAFTQDQIGKVKIPVLHIGGVWDGDGIGTKLNWAGRRQNGYRNQWLIFGPWVHAFNTTRIVSGQDYGEDALIELDTLYLRFFDTYLKGKSVQMDQQPRARIFVTGENRWYRADDWPLPFTKRTTWYLGGGKANSDKGQGKLLKNAASASKDTYRYEPAKLTAPNEPQNLDIPKSLRGKDVLYYRSAPFAKRTLVTGPFRAELTVQTSAKDATFHVLLASEGRDGTMKMICMPGTRRLSFERAEPIKPNATYQLVVEPWDFAHRFEPGEKLVMMVTSNLFPRFARNPGSGEPDGTATKLLSATQSVLKGGSQGSRVQFFSYDW